MDDCGFISVGIWMGKYRLMDLPSIWIASVITKLGVLSISLVYSTEGLMYCNGRWSRATLGEVYGVIIL